MRVYDAATGKLIKIFTNIIEPGKGAELTTFCFDGRDRKIYFGDSNGSLNIYNANNGILMKKVGQVEIVERKKNSNINKDAENSPKAKKRMQKFASKK